MWDDLELLVGEGFIFFWNLKMTQIMIFLLAFLVSFKIFCVATTFKEWSYTENKMTCRMKLEKL